MNEDVARPAGFVIKGVETSGATTMAADRSMSRASACPVCGPAPAEHL